MAGEGLAVVIVEYVDFGLGIIAIMIIGFFIAFVRSLMKDSDSSWGGGGLSNLGNRFKSGAKRTGGAFGKLLRKEEGDVAKTEEFDEREWHDLKDIKSKLERAKTVEDLKDIKKNLTSTFGIERVERNMERHHARMVKHGQKLLENLSDGKDKQDLQRALTMLGKYDKVLVATLSRGGLLEQALTRPNPSNWNKTLFGSPATGNVAKDNFRMRRENSLKVVIKVQEWLEGLLILLKKYHHKLVELEAA